MTDLNDIHAIAQQALENIINEDPNLTEAEVDELCLKKENDLAWIFVAGIPKLVRDGWVPGAITIFIDKKDRHVWTEQEQEKFHCNQDNIRQRAGFLRQK
jgi:hypothetical protein